MSAAVDMTEISTQTLHVVAKELSATLAEARTALEAYAERNDQRQLLEKCADQLHQAYGVLRLVEVYGAALLAEEMEQVTRYLIEAGESGHQVEGLDALMRAMVQLPAYLERVLSGGRDIALVLLPLLNDLRAVRGSPLLSEGTLLLLNLKSDQPAQPQSPTPGEPPLSVKQWARRLRTRFQLGLLGFIRGERVEQNLEILAKTAERFEQVATTQPVFQLWWVTGAVLEALRANALDNSATIKRLLGQCDRQIKRLYEIGEARYCESPPVELLNNLLYYVARATVNRGRIAAVRASFKLTDLLPVDVEVEHERESLSAPSVKLMHTVAAAIKEDLSKVKDVLDIFVRRGGGQPAELVPQLEMLKKISDTMGVLGLGELRQSVLQETTELSAVLTSGEVPSETALLKVAATLLAVEDSLDDQLVRLILPNGAAAQARSAAGGADDVEFRQVTEAVLRECVVNLARVKEAVSLAVQKTVGSVPQGLDNVPQLMRGITAGLLMLGKGRAVEIMDGVAAQVRAIIEPSAPLPTPQRLERLADAIVSVEYYMETLQSGRSDPWYMLDNAEACLKTLAAEEDSAVPLVAPLAADAVVTVKLEPQRTPEPRLVAKPAPPPAPVAADTQPDPEFVELFIEEAKEEFASIRQTFPLWDHNPMDTEALVTLRRSFHTLKGSGRMVGAKLIGEFSWSIENLLNRLLDKTISRTPGMMALLRSAVDLLPALVEQLESGRQAAPGADALMARAQAFASGREAEQQVEAVAPEDQVPEQPIDAQTVVLQPSSAAERAQMDPLLHDIYSKEAAGHLQIIRDYLAKRGGQPAPHDLPESVYRAIHTLSGSSKMAEARHGIRVTEPLNHYMRKVFESSRGLGPEGLEVLAQSVKSIEDVVAHINESTGYFSDQPSLVLRIKRLESELDGELAKVTTDSNMSAIVPILAVPAPPESAQAPAEAARPAFAATPALEPESGSEASYDPEIAAIFTEEAAELLEAADAALTAWNQQRRDEQRAAELQRQLHTLKGGARMAGLASIGDLSHELETLVIQIDGGLVQPDDRAYAVLQESLDELAHMRDKVSAGQVASPAASLIARIRALGDGAAAPADAPTAAPIGVPAAESPALASAEMTEEAPPAAPSEPAPFEDSIRMELSVDRELPSLASSLDQSQPSAAPEALVLPGREAAHPERSELARVDADLLDSMLNNSGEVSIFRSRLDQQVGSIDFNLAELARTVTRLKEQLRGLEIETEAQILHRHQEDDPRREDFDPLELDRYSTIQQFSRALAETASDVASLQTLLETLTREAQNLLTQQSRVITELQNALMRTRMVPFQRHVQRLTRLVRQTANDQGKRAELAVEGASGELDRQVLERMLPPLEHMLRNSVVHGIETTEKRVIAGKPEAGRITVSLSREGAEVIIVVSDDGAGINVKLIREKAGALGLLDTAHKLSDEEAMQLILEPGFSTAGNVTQSAGRGVGMDVVATEVKKLGGALFIESHPGRGTRFTVRLPFTLAISQALIVRVADELYSLPLPTVEGVVRLPRNIVAKHLAKDAPLFEYGGQNYRFQHLGSFVGLGPSVLPDTDVSMSVVLIRAGEHSTALVADELVGSREIVVKSLGPQISGIRGIAGATILGDGRIVIILDMGALVRSEWRSRAVDLPPADSRDKRTLVLVVDDSITVRRVTQRLLERNGMRVITAKDGVDAVSILQEQLPDIILLDIEMPRMDGYEVAAHVRNDPRLKDVPIVMITSRVGEKHRARAIELGVDDYLGKPYQESQLLDAIEPLVTHGRTAVT